MKKIPFFLSRARAPAAARRRLPARQYYHLDIVLLLIPLETTFKFGKADPSLLGCKKLTVVLDECIAPSTIVSALFW